MQLDFLKVSCDVTHETIGSLYCFVKAAKVTTESIAIQFTKYNLNCFRGDQSVTVPCLGQKLIVWLSNNFTWKK